jgi:hypothetical protein
MTLFMTILCMAAAKASFGNSLDFPHASNRQAIPTLNRNTLETAVAFKQLGFEAKKNDIQKMIKISDEVKQPCPLPPPPPPSPHSVLKSQKE